MAGPTAYTESRRVLKYRRSPSMSWSREKVMRRWHKPFEPVAPSKTGFCVWALESPSMRATLARKWESLYALRVGSPVADGTSNKKPMVQGRRCCGRDRMDREKRRCC